MTIQIDVECILNFSANVAITVNHCFTLLAKENPPHPINVLQQDSNDLGMYILLGKQSRMLDMGMSSMVLTSFATFHRMARYIVPDILVYCQETGTGSRPLPSPVYSFIWLHNLHLLYP